MIAAAATQHLPGVLHSLEPRLEHFGYLTDPVRLYTDFAALDAG